MFKNKQLKIDCKKISKKIAYDFLMKYHNEGKYLIKLNFSI